MSWEKKPLIIRPDFDKAAQRATLGPGVSEAFRKQLEGFSLTTANILYRLPDHPGILQNYIWQDHDIAPEFPELRKFLDFWSRELDGLLHSVTVAHAKLIKPAEFRAVAGEFRLN